FGMKKRKAPGFPETSQPFSIVSCQLSPQVFFQIVKPYRLYFRQHFFQHCALLNEPPCPGFSLLHPIPCLGFLQAVLCLQQFLFFTCHRFTSVSARSGHSPAHQPAPRPPCSGLIPAGVWRTDWKHCPTSRIPHGAGQLLPASYILLGPSVP